MIRDFLKRAIGAVRVARDNVNAFGAAQDAYDAGAGLPGVILAYTGATPSPADNLTLVAVMELIDAGRRSVSNVALTAESAAQTAAHAARTCELAARTLTDIAIELRDFEALVARLQGGAPLKDVLEGDA